MTWAVAGTSGISGTSSAAANTIVTSAISVTAGELLVVAFRWEGTAGDTITGTYSDGGAGLSWSSVIYSGTSSGETERMAVAYATVLSTGNITVTFTFDSSATRTYRTWHSLRATFTESSYSLADSATAQDGANVSTWLCGEVTVSSNDLVLVHCAHYNSGTNASTPSGFTHGYDGGLFELFYQIYSSGGDYTVSAGWSAGTESYATVALVFHGNASATANSYYYMSNQ